ncbi:hypothetical protein EV356DRAFT_520071 [Viridothelium virens]|uniref:H/ACA ribonucleoprotein complex non-core subunit NAF1 n=1 Tax=Viridothelium virens TaxID=1048519 RepID=A0A6A6GXN4_VIRVR|nr:hypothetical protein EV356DRAFT_520071 [Viridothelium virens]
MADNSDNRAQPSGAQNPMAIPGLGELGREGQGAGAEPAREARESESEDSTESSDSVEGETSDGELAVTGKGEDSEGEGEGAGEDGPGNRRAGSSRHLQAVLEKWSLEEEGGAVEGDGSGAEEEDPLFNKLAADPSVAALLEGDVGEDRDEGDDVEKAPRTKHEVEPERSVPQNVGDTIDEPIELLGEVDGILRGDAQAVVRSARSGDEEVVDFGTPLCLETKRVIGHISDIVAQVNEPRYIVDFKSYEAMEGLGIKLKAKVYYFTKSAKSLRTVGLKEQKFTDASNKDDEEAGESDSESDDERAAAKAKADREIKRNERAKRHKDYAALFADPVMDKWGDEANRAKPPRRSTHTQPSRGGNYGGRPQQQRQQQQQQQQPYYQQQPLGAMLPPPMPPPQMHPQYQQRPQYPPPPPPQYGMVPQHPQPNFSSFSVPPVSPAVPSYGSQLPQPQGYAYPPPPPPPQQQQPATQDPRRQARPPPPPGASDASVQGWATPSAFGAYGPQGRGYGRGNPYPPPGGQR